MATKEMRKVSIKMAVTIKRCKIVFMEGEAPGVIATQVVSFERPVDDDSKDWQIAAMLNDKRAEFIADNVEVVMEQTG